MDALRPHGGLASPQSPAWKIDHMSSEQKRARILADIKLAQNSGWDEQILATSRNGGECVAMPRQHLWG
jgi:hypothetical protein